MVKMMNILVIQNKVYINILENSRKSVTYSTLFTAFFI